MEIPYFIWMIIIPLIASPLIYLCGRIDSARNNNTSQILAMVSLLAVWIPFLPTILELNLKEQLTFTLGAVSMCLDGLGLIVAAVALTLGTFVVLFSGPYMSAEFGKEKYSPCSQQ